MGRLALESRTDGLKVRCPVGAAWSVRVSFGCPPGYHCRSEATRRAASGVCVSYPGVSRHCPDAPTVRPQTYPVGMKCTSSDGTWVVELVSRTASRGREGDWLVAKHHGFKVGEARNWDGVARLGVDTGDLRETLAGV